MPFAVRRQRKPCDAAFSVSVGAAEFAAVRSLTQTGHLGRQACGSYPLLPATVFATADRFTLKADIDRHPGAVTKLR